jgi:RHS repeat-associated protein
MTAMLHLPLLEWDFKDQLQRVDLGGGGAAYYTYHSAGQRVRKVVERQGALREERIYLGGYEVFRKGNGASVKLERETLHVMDDKRRVVLVETKTIDTQLPLPSLQSAVRYQLDNHLGSAILEIDQVAAVISYEEYYPYGCTSYQAARTLAEVSLKRYRYTGKERDEETGLYYHGARYYAAWLGRWTRCDPAGMADTINPYTYLHNNPVRFIDPTGSEATESALNTVSGKPTDDYRSAEGTAKMGDHAIEGVGPDMAQKVLEQGKEIVTHLKHNAQGVIERGKQTVRQIRQGSERGNVAIAKEIASSFTVPDPQAVGRVLAHPEGRKQVVKVFLPFLSAAADATDTYVKSSARASQQV